MGLDRSMQAASHGGLLFHARVVEIAKQVPPATIEDLVAETRTGPLVVGEDLMRRNRRNNHRAEDGAIGHELFVT